MPHSKQTNDHASVELAVSRPITKPPFFRHHPHFFLTFIRSLSDQPALSITFQEGGWEYLGNMSHCNSILHVPTDIAELILDVLDTERDMKPFKACSLTCSLFRAYCMKHLFASFMVIHSREDRMMSFQHILGKNPQLGSYVRNFRLVNCQFDESELEFLRHLRNVRRFTFGQYECLQEWSKMSVALTSSLPTFLQSKDISELDVMNLSSVPGTIFAHLPNIVALCLKDTSITGDSTSQVKVTRTLQKLVLSARRWKQ
ncbi:hypothetical protein B0H34DRAFT_210914 [Crassisporium funariophilum]|nr:hypothetical protein B0H34DRAFT_210914 [Crassisporium funariophilum]